ncbi:hypothetical protein BDB00DRAFT_230144 [Zychaea mexicana]|uniref:uncharacterized protein n=1 Tax=Zychaea mexicana TaxID=64656 RepID=UPI0022FED98F|nr:uncharacterized protein BDB00DRAFT_230144 [Zychaea mexicana]KAI9499341.1 hypothetical protein BDB00DRAFT_230144 [Zychaea mexicana]
MLWPMSFAGVVDFEVNYDLPFMTVVSNFYSNLIEKDLTVLCFDESQGVCKNTLQGTYILPSWSGISGGSYAPQNRVIAQRPRRYSLDRPDHFSRTA